LNPQFGIRFGGPDRTRLPTACMSPPLLIGRNSANRMFSFLC